MRSDLIGFQSDFCLYEPLDEFKKWLKSWNGQISLECIQGAEEWKPHTHGEAEFRVMIVESKLFEKDLQAGVQAKPEPIDKQRLYF